MTTRRRRRHTPEQIVRKLRDADAMLNAGKDEATVQQLQSEFKVSERRACEVVDQPRSTQRYEPSPRDDEAALTKRMLQLAKQRPRFGYRQISRLLRAEGWQASATRVYRLWRREGLKMPQKKRKRPSGCCGSRR